MQLSYHGVPALEPEEILLAAIVRRAIRDAKEDRSERVRAEAAAWLWDVAPRVAVVAKVPRIATDHAVNF